MINPIKQILSLFKKPQLMSPAFYLDEAKKEAMKSTCVVTHWGAVLVDWQGRIVARGHNQVAHTDLYRYCKPCIRKDIRSCTETERCAAIHAEVDVIQNALRNGHKNMKYLSMYLYGYSELEGTPDEPILIRYYPCMACAKELLHFKVGNIWFYRPVAVTEEERDWLPFPKHEQDYDKTYLPDFIRGNQLWFHAGMWLGLEGHTISIDTGEVFKLGQRRKTS
jgi:deoxycytidylate deaminase